MRLTLLILIISACTPIIPLSGPITLPTCVLPTQVSVVLNEELIRQVRIGGESIVIASSDLMITNDARSHNNQLGFNPNCVGLC
jgi:hypothetical protein